MKKLTVRKSGELHPKSWGHEEWIENIPEYCGKILSFREGTKCSMHFHMKKLETMYLQHGHMKIHFIDPDDATRYTVELWPGDSIQIPRGQAHQIEAVQDSKLFEFSTTHEETDSYRVEKGSS